MQDLKPYQTLLSQRRYQEALNWCKQNPVDLNQESFTLSNCWKFLESQLRLSIHCKDLEHFENLYQSLLNLENLDLSYIAFLNYLKLEYLHLRQETNQIKELIPYIQIQHLKPKDNERYLQIKLKYCEVAQSAQAPTSSINQIDQLLTNNSYSEALPLLEELAKENPGNFKLLYNLAITNLELGLWIKAVGLLKSCLLLNPLHQKSCFTLANIAKSIGDQKSCDEYLRKGFQMNPFSQEASSVTAEFGLDLASKTTIETL